MIDKDKKGKLEKKETEQLKRERSERQEQRMPSHQFEKEEE